MLLDSCDNIHGATDVISDYITFCEDMIIPKSKFTLGVGIIILGKNNNTLTEKKIAFQAEDQTERKRVQSKLRREVREAKKKNKEQIEFQFPTGNMRNAWKGLKTLAGHPKPKLNSLNKPGDKQKERSDELNDFYC